MITLREYLNLQKKEYNIPTQEVEYFLNLLKTLKFEEKSPISLYQKNDKFVVEALPKIHQRIINNGIQNIS